MTTELEEPPRFMFQQVVGCYKIGALACSTLQVATKLEPFGDQVFSWNHAVLLHQSPQTCAMRILEKRKHEKTHATHKTLYIWLVVWNIWIIFPYIGNVIIPTDELHHFSEGWVYINQYIYIYMYHDIPMICCYIPIPHSDFKMVF